MGVTCDRTSTRAVNLNGAPDLISSSSTVGGATGWIWFSRMAWPMRVLDQVPGDLVLDLALVHLLEQRARHLAGPETGQAHAAAEGVVGLLELGDHVRPGQLELDAFLDGREVLNRDLHGVAGWRLSYLRAHAPGASHP